MYTQAFIGEGYDQVVRVISLTALCPGEGWRVGYLGKTGYLKNTDWEACSKRPFRVVFGEYDSKTSYMEDAVDFSRDELVLVVV